jgi:acetylornithine deacetylase/succinyl-diaminopimelate desuccinylase-like protein
VSDYLEKLLCELISINSSNPDYSESAPGEKEIGNFIYDIFCKNKVDCIKQDVAPGRFNIIAKVPGRQSGPALLLCSHLDTVYLDGMKFEAVIDEKYIYGPGACDTKSSLAVMIKAAIEYSKSAERKQTVYFLGTVSEESMHLGIRKFMDKYKDITGDIGFCIIGEPTALDAGIAHKGSLKFTIKTEGKSAHGSTPELGLNAINMMCELITIINKKLIPGYEKISDKLLGKATLNIGVIRGGSAFNIVPDFCRIELDRRLLPSETPEDVLKSFSGIIAEIREGNKNFAAGIEKINDYIPSLNISRSGSFIEPFCVSCRKFYEESIMKGLSYATDGGFTFQGGIPTVIFGPGNIKDSHRLEELVSRKQLNLAFEILKDYLFAF